METIEKKKLLKEYGLACDTDGEWRMESREEEDMA